MESILEDFSSLKVQRSDVQINESEQVGKGAFGKVMKGKFCGMEVVVKEPLDTSSEALENFKRESDIISRLHHPNVVRCLATVDGCEEQPPLIVLESADGGSLQKRLSKGPLHPLEAFSFAVDAGRALLYLHSLPCPILHGDLHFGNFLLFQRGFPSRLKLCDFGAANTISPNQGTPNFNAYYSFLVRKNCLCFNYASTVRLSLHFVGAIAKNVKKERRMSLEFVGDPRDSEH